MRSDSKNHLSGYSKIVNKTLTKFRRSAHRLIAGPCSFRELEAKAPEYISVMRQMVNHGVRLYYAEKSTVSAKVRDFALVQDGETLLVFKWKPHNDNHSIRDAEVTWDNREAANLKALWEVEIKKSIRSGVVQRVEKEGRKLKARTDSLED